MLSEVNLPERSEGLKEIDETAATISRELAREMEKLIRSELWRLRTHRLNVRLIQTPPKLVIKENQAHAIQYARLDPILPRGPRPLP